MTDSKQSYYCKCAECDKELYDMLNEQPCSHLTLEIVVRNETHIEQEHKRFCNLKCLKAWTNK